MVQDNVVLFRLREELEDAQQRHRGAKERFWEVAGRPRRLPRLPLSDPDGGGDVRRAFAEEAQARDQLLKALVRLNKFLVDGIVPDDLKDDAQPLVKACGDGS